MLDILDTVNLQERKEFMKIRIKKAQIPYFISGIIIFTNRFNGVNINQFVKYIVAGIWALYYIAIEISSQRDKIQKSERLKRIHEQYSLMIGPFLMMGLYSALLWLFREDVTLFNYTRLISTVLYLAIAWGYANCGYYLFGSATINMLFYSGVASYFGGSIIPLIINYNVQGIWNYLVSTITGVDTSASYMMEVHDLTFAMGVFFLYYLFFERRNEKAHNKKILLALLLIILGLKRIEVLALVIAIVAYITVLRKGKTIKARSLFFFFVFAFVSLGYVYMIRSGLLETLASKFGINFMGRLSYYSYACAFCVFSPLYFGQGYTYFTKYWSKLYESGFRIDGYGIAASIHSDILVMFIEIGFVGMLAWIFYCFKFKTDRLSRRNGVAVGEYYLLATIYMFILYLTDNTSTYFLTQMVYYLIPLAMENVQKFNIIFKKEMGESKV